MSKQEHSRPQTIETPSEQSATESTTPAVDSEAEGTEEAPTPPEGNRPSNT